MAYTSHDPFAFTVTSTKGESQTPFDALNPFDDPFIIRKESPNITSTNSSPTLDNLRRKSMTNQNPTEHHTLYNYQEPNFSSSSSTVNNDIMKLYQTNNAHPQQQLYNPAYQQGYLAQPQVPTPYESNATNPFFQQNATHTNAYYTLPPTHVTQPISYQNSVPYTTNILQPKLDKNLSSEEILSILDPLKQQNMPQELSMNKIDNMDISFENEDSEQLRRSSWNTEDLEERNEKGNQDFSSESDNEEEKMEVQKPVQADQGNYSKHSAVRGAKTSEKWLDARLENSPREELNQNAIQKEFSGSILARISLRTIIGRQWKPSWFIFATPNCLRVYRSKDDYEHYPIGTMIKKEINIGSKHVCSTIKKKFYPSRGPLYYFTVWKYEEHVRVVDIKFASPYEQELVTLRGHFVSAMNFIRKSMVENKSSTTGGYIHAKAVNNPRR